MAPTYTTRGRGRARRRMICLSWLELLPHGTLKLLLKSGHDFRHVDSELVHRTPAGLRAVEVSERVQLLYGKDLDHRVEGDLLENIDANNALHLSDERRPLPVRQLSRDFGDTVVHHFRRRHDTHVPASCRPTLFDSVLP